MNIIFSARTAFINNIYPIDARVEQIRFRHPAINNTEFLSLNCANAEYYKSCEVICGGNHKFIDVSFIDECPNLSNLNLSMTSSSIYINGEVKKKTNIKYLSAEIYGDVRSVNCLLGIICESPKLERLRININGNLDNDEISKIKSVIKPSIDTIFECMGVVV